MIRPAAPPRCPTPSQDHNAELLLITEASHWLSKAEHTEVEALLSVTAILNRQQRLAAHRASGRPLDT